MDPEYITLHGSDGPVVGVLGLDKTLKGFRAASFLRRVAAVRVISERVPAAPSCRRGAGYSQQILVTHRSRGELYAGENPVTSTSGL